MPTSSEGPEARPSRPGTAACPNWAFGYSLTGTSHLRVGKVCQDAHALRLGACAFGSFLAASVADGHGDSRYDRSEHGANLAARAAVEEMEGLLGRCGRMPQSGEVSARFHDDYPQAVASQWQGLVREHAGVKAAKRSHGGEPTLYTRYGTTLLSALVWKNLLLLGQLGDGDIVVKGADGSLERVFPPDRDTLGSETHSLSSEEAPALWRLKALPLSGGERLMLATDGLSDSFTSEGEFLKFAGDLLERCDQYPLGAVAEELPGWLRRCSEGGSGDDITLVMAGLGSIPAPDSDSATSGAPRGR